MREKLYQIYARYKLAIIIALGIIIVGLIGLILFFTFSNKSSIKEFKNDNYSFKYDITWKVVKKDSQEVTLEHNKGSKLNIEIVNLQEEYRYSSIDDMLDELLYDIETQNTAFKLLYKEKEVITKNEYDGYKMLYENGDSQAMVLVGKKSDKLIIFTYEAKNDYFDILLDSVLNIIYDFNTIEKKYNLTHNLKLETSSIEYNDSREVINLLKDTKQHEIASNHYNVKYSISDKFRIRGVDSSSGYFEFSGLETGSIRLRVNIYKKNIYEYLDKDEGANVYQWWSTYKNDKDYSMFEETVDKFPSDYESYIYKNSYYYDKAVTYDENFNSQTTSELKENIILMYALDKNHILLFEISSSKVAIPKELINMIKIDSSENYSSYFASTNKDGFIISNLKRLVNFEDESVEEIILRIPDKYKEQDKSSNIYEERYYVLDYNEELKIYDYEIEYYLTNKSTKMDNQVSIYNSLFSSAYGEYKDLSYSGEITLNNKTFKVYDGGYTNISGIMFTSKNRAKYYKNVKLLFYELSSGGYLIIKIDGNGVQISDNLLNELTNFEV